MQASIGGKTLDTTTLPKFNLFDFKKPMQASIGGVSVNTPKTPINATIGEKPMPAILPKQPLQTATIGGKNFQGVSPKPVEKPIQSEQKSIQESISSSFLSELEYDIKNGATQEEILQAYPEVKGDTKLVNELLYDIKNGATVDEVKIAYPELQTQQPIQPKNGNIVTQSFGNLIGGAISQAPNIAGQAGSFFIGKPVDFALKQAGVNLPSLSEHFKQAGLDDKAKLQEVLGVDPESFFTQVGQFGAEIGSLATGTGEAKLLAKISEKAPAVAKGLQQLSEKAPTTYKYLKSALAGGKEMAKYDIISKGEVTPESVGIGAGLGVALPVSSKLLGKAKQFITKTTPENLMASQMMNRADLQNVSERLSKLTGKELDMADASKWLLNNVKQGGDKTFIRKQVQEATKKSQKEASELLNKNTEIFTTKETESLKKALKEKLSNFGKFQKDGSFVPTAGNEESAKKVFDILGKDGLLLSDMNNGRRILGENLWNKNGTAKELQAKQGWQNVWKDTSQFIENKAPGFRELNKNVEVGIAVNKGIAKKEASDLARQMLAYTGFGGALGTYSAYQSGDPTDILKGMIAGYAGGKIKGALTSTTAKTKLAVFLNKFNKQEKEAIIKWAKSKGESALPTEVETKIKGLLPAPGKSSYKSPAIITPQTMEKAVISESKIPLKNTKYGNTKPNNTPSNNTIPSISHSTTSNSISKPANLTPSSVSNGGKKLVKKTK